MQPLTSHLETFSPTLRITRAVLRSAAPSGSSTLPQPPPSSLEHDSPTKDKGKKRKREDEDDGNDDDDDDGDDDGDDDDDDDDEAYQDQHDITAQSLVQHVTSNTMSVKTRLTCDSAGVGTSGTSRWDYHHPSLRQPRTRVCPPSRLSDALRFGPHRTAHVC